MALGFVKPASFGDAVNRLFLFGLGLIMVTIGLGFIYMALCGAEIIPTAYSIVETVYAAKTAVGMLLLGQAFALLGTGMVWLGWRGD